MATKSFISYLNEPPTSHSQVAAPFLQLQTCSADLHPQTRRHDSVHICRCNRKWLASMAAILCGNLVTSVTCPCTSYGSTNPNVAAGLHEILLLLFGKPWDMRISVLHLFQCKLQDLIQGNWMYDLHFNKEPKTVGHFVVMCWFPIDTEQVLSVFFAIFFIQWGGSPKFLILLLWPVCYILDPIVVHQSKFSHPGPRLLLLQLSLQTTEPFHRPDLQPCLGFF